MSHFAIADSLDVSYQQYNELTERDKLLVQVNYPHRHPPVTFPVASATRVLIAKNHIPDVAIHHVKDKLTSILYQHERRLKEQHALIVIVASQHVGVSNAVNHTTR